MNRNGPVCECQLMDPNIGHRTWRTLEPIHAAIYFVPEADEEYGRLGFERRMSGYFPSRSAPIPISRPWLAP